MAKLGAKTVVVTRATSIGCGALSLTFAVLTFVGVIANFLHAAERNTPPTWLVYTIGLTAAVVALLFWINALLPLGEDDDLFSGSRGGALAAIVVLLLVVGGMILWLMISPDAQRGFMAGWNK